MSQKNFTSHGHPIPGAPYRPDQRPRNVARCGGPGLCPDCSREAGLGNRKNRMTTIDYQQAVEAVQGAIPGINVLTAERALTAATPHLRAGIAEEVRDLRSQFHDDAKTAFGRIGSSTEVYLNALDDVLALLRRSTND